jgi:hypothetical protein
MTITYDGPRCPFCQSEETWTKITRATIHRNGVPPLVEDYRRAYCDGCGDTWQDRLDFWRIHIRSAPQRPQRELIPGYSLAVASLLQWRYGWQVATKGG